MPHLVGAQETTLRVTWLVSVCLVLSALLTLALLVASDPHDVLAVVMGQHTPVYVPTTTNLTHLDTQMATTSLGNRQPTMRLVESLPVGEFDLESTLEPTWQVLLQLTQQATTEIAISAMYWNLLGDDDRKIYTDAEMDQFGADRGRALFTALCDAAKRGVRIRILTAGDSIQGKHGLPDEVEQIVAASPQNVDVRTWSGAYWYGGGILHHKIWIIDQRHIYIGSANMDWKSLAQVMEMGVVLRDLPVTSSVLVDISNLYERWFQWADRHVRVGLTPSTYYSNRFQAELRVPPWSMSIKADKRTGPPAGWDTHEARGNMDHQLEWGTSQLFVASSPRETTVTTSSTAIPRTFDEDALVYTIQTAQTRVSLSVMDFTPYSMYPLATHDGPIAWPALTDAIIAGVFAKRGLQIRLLISEWQHSHAVMFNALRNLEQHAELCTQMKATCRGSLEIRIFRVPGWQNTTSTTTKRRWPAFTRVNHAKYIVSDQRVNIGTSNMEWSYFYTTAGISLNTDDPTTRDAMQAVFDRNWESPYATPL